MTPETLMAQVIALRGQVDAIAAMVETLREEWPVPGPPPCPHSEVEDYSTLAEKKLICKRCGHDVTASV